METESSLYLVTGYEDEDIVWLIWRHIRIRIENCDWVCIINQEIKSDTGELFLTFKLLKRRYRSSETTEDLRKLDYFNHPYDPENTIRLIDDYDLPNPLSLKSLATKFEPANPTMKGQPNAVEREAKEEHDMYDEYGYFDENVVIN